MKITLPSSGLAVTPGKLICIGKNYALHAAEMGGSVPEAPMIFLKPPTSLVRSGGQVVLPVVSQEVHHEVELVVVIGRGGKNISEENALDHVDGYAIGLDMTARDLQQQAKEKGEPWAVAKGFDTFAPMGKIAPSQTVLDPQDLELTLRVNGEMRQKGSTGDMIFSVKELIAYASTIYTLRPGDLIFTGTPEGVGSVLPGDVLEAAATGLPSLNVEVIREAD